MELIDYKNEILLTIHPWEDNTDVSASDMPDRLEFDKILNLLIQQAPAIHAYKVFPL